MGFLKGFVKGLKRANSASHIGDIEGSITGGKGKMPLSIENDAVVLWAVGTDDITIGADEVKSIDLISSDVVIKDMASNGGKVARVNIYNVKFKNGKTGSMRLFTGTAHKVLAIWDNK